MRVFLVVRVHEMRGGEAGRREASGRDETGRDVVAAAVGIGGVDQGLADGFECAPVALRARCMAAGKTRAMVLSSSSRVRPSEASKRGRPAGLRGRRYRARPRAASRQRG